MAKYITNDAMDGELGQIIGTHFSITDTQPTTFGEITELAGGAFSGSFTYADGTPSGREVESPAQSGVSITQSGTANHICMTNGTDTLYSVTTVTSQVLTSGGTVDVPAYKYTVLDPS